MFFNKTRRMKSIVTAFISGAVMVGMMLPVTTSLAAETEINETNFPDAAFRQYVSDMFDKDANGVLSDDEKNSVTELNIRDLGIVSPKGCELFPNLTKVDCSSNDEFKVEELPSTITYLHCANIDELASLDLSKFPNLIYLSVWGCDKITTIETKYCPNLEELDCSARNIDSLDLSQNNKLRILDVSSAHYIDETKIIWPTSSVIESMDFSNDSFTNLDVSMHSKLEKLDLTGNENITSLDLSKNTNLTALEIGGTGIMSLDDCNIGSKSTLKSLDMKGSTGSIIYADVDLSAYTGLETLVLDTSDAGLDLSSNKQLRSLAIWDRNLESLDLSNNTELRKLELVYGTFETIDLSNNTNLWSVSIRFGSLKTLDVSKLQNLQVLDVWASDMVTLDASMLTNLGSFEGSYTQMVSLHLPDSMTINSDTVKFSGKYAYEYAGTGKTIDLKTVDQKFDYSKVKNVVGAENTGKALGKITSNTIEYDYMLTDSYSMHVIINAPNVTLYDPETDEDSTTGEPTEDTTAATTEVTTESTTAAATEEATETSTEAATEATTETSSAVTTETGTESTSGASTDAAAQTTTVATADAPTTGAETPVMVVFAVMAVSAIAMVYFNKKRA